MKALLAVLFLPAVLLAAPGDFVLTKLNNPAPGQAPVYFPPTPNTVWTFNSTGVLTAKPISEIGGATTWGAITGTLSSQLDLAAALNLKAPLASPTFTGIPAAVTAAPGTNSTQLATTAFVAEATSGMESPLTFGTGLSRIGDNVTIDNTVVTLTGAQALTNKTISASTLDGSVIGGSTPAAGTFTTAAVSAANPALIFNNSTDTGTYFLGTRAANNAVYLAGNWNPDTTAIPNTGRSTSYIGVWSQSGAGIINFGTSTVNNVQPTERMRINAMGNLLVNTAADDSSGSKLQVNGAVRAVGAINATTDMTAGATMTTAGFRTAIRTLTTTTTAAATDHTLLVDATGASFTVNLPSAASNSGREYCFKKLDASANTVTVDANGSQTIDGALTQVIGAQYATFTIKSNGTMWAITSFYEP